MQRPSFRTISLSSSAGSCDKSSRMRFANSLRLLCAVFLAWPLSIHAASTPPADQLLPAETVAFFTVTDREKVGEYFRNSPMGRLWDDPAMKPFRASVVARLGESVFTPLERALGNPSNNLADLMGGQITFAVVGPGAAEGTNPTPRLVLIIDAKGKSNELRSVLDSVKKQWIASGNRLRNDPVRGVEFSTFFVGTQDFGSALRMVLPGAPNPNVTPGRIADDPEAGLLAITVGQSGSLLLIGSDLQTLGRISTRQTEPVGLALSSQADYKAVQESLTRNALAYGWINTKSILKMVLRGVDQGGMAAAGIPAAFQPQRLIESTGLGALEAVTFKIEGDAEGLLAEASLRVPQAERRGIFKIIDVESKDSSPPLFVSANAVNFSRWRWDGQKAWSALDTMLKSISPQLSGVIELGFSLIGKDTDPNYDLQKSLLGNLGDDLISIQLPSAERGAAATPGATALLLVASPNPDELARAVQAASVLLPTQAIEAAEGESMILGRKLYMIGLPSGALTNAPRLYFATNQGYLVFSVSRPTLEDFLSNRDAANPRLRDRPGLVEAARRVGGFSTGLFGYTDQLEFLRQTLAELTAHSTGPGSVAQILNPLSDALASLPQSAPNIAGIDFKLLPPFEKIAPYFHFVVYAELSDRDAISFRYFSPVPPKPQ